MADLDVERIAAAALAVLDARGLAGFTMRAVAEALDVTPMALYHHVEDKAALAVLVVEAARRDTPVPDPTGDWREDMWRMASWMRESTRAHPNVARLRATFRVWTPDIVGMTERWVGFWTASGLPAADAVRAANLCSLAIIGIVEQEAALRDLDPPDRAILAAAPNARRAFEASGRGGEDFEFLVRALIDGIYMRAAAPS